MTLGTFRLNAQGLRCKPSKLYNQIVPKLLSFHFDTITKVRNSSLNPKQFNATILKCLFKEPAQICK